MFFADKSTLQNIFVINYSQLLPLQNSFYVGNISIGTKSKKGLKIQSFPKSSEILQGEKCNKLSLIKNPYKTKT